MSDSSEPRDPAPFDVPTPEPGADRASVAAPGPAPAPTADAEPLPDDAPVVVGSTIVRPRRTIRIGVPDGWLRALLAGVEAALLGWGLVTVLVLVGYWGVSENPWLSHSTWSDAMVVAGDAWGQALGAHTSVAGLSVRAVPTLVPLLLVLLLRVLLWQSRHFPAGALWWSVGGFAVTAEVALLSTTSRTSAVEALLGALGVPVLAVVWALAGRARRRRREDRRGRGGVSPARRVVAAVRDVVARRRGAGAAPEAGESAGGAESPAVEDGEHGGGPAVAGVRASVSDGLVVAEAEGLAEDGADAADAPMPLRALFSREGGPLPAVPSFADQVEDLRTPGALASEVRAGGRAAALMLGLVTLLASLLTVAALVTGREGMRGIVDLLGTESTVDRVVLALAQVAYAPTLVAWALSWCAGPGFFVGTDALHAPGVATVAPIPAIPVLGALPTVTPGDVVALVLVAVGVAVGGVLRWRRPASTLLSEAVRALVAGGVVAGVVAVWCSLAVLTLGDGRMSVLGPRVAATTGMVTLEVAAVAGLVLLLTHADALVVYARGWRALCARVERWRVERAMRRAVSVPVSAGAASAPSEGERSVEESRLAVEEARGGAVDAADPGGAVSADSADEMAGDMASWDTEGEAQHEEER